MINEYYAKKYCKEDISLIENYEQAVNDNNQMWVCHHMTENWWNCTRKELIENECYYNRKACELIFLTPEEHKRLHNKGRIFSEETRKKMSESMKGRTSPMKGVTLSEETRKKISEAKKGKKLKPFTEEHRKKMSEAKKGRRLSEETRKKISESKKGRTSNRKGVTLSAETRKKISEAMKCRCSAKKNLETINA